MKFLLLFMFVAVALAAQESEVGPDQLAQALARSFRMDPVDTLECVRKSEATEDDMRCMVDALFDVGDTEVTDMKSLKKGSCAMVCCSQKKGYMVGGVVQEEEVFKSFQTMGMSEDKQSEMRNIVRICKEQVTDTSDECMAGFKYMKCSIRSQGTYERK